MHVVYVLVVLLGIVLYLAYVACAVPISAISAFAVYSLGLPVAYLISLGRVLLSQDPSRPSPCGGAETASGCRSRGGPILLRARGGRRRARAADRVPGLPTLLAMGHTDHRVGLHR